jgi:hypothetical protein
MKASREHEGAAGTFGILRMSVRCLSFKQMRENHSSYPVGAESSETFLNGVKAVTTAGVAAEWHSQQ